MRPRAVPEVSCQRRNPRNAAGGPDPATGAGGAEGEGEGEAGCLGRTVSLALRLALRERLKAERALGPARWTALALKLRAALPAAGLVWPQTGAAVALTEVVVGAGVGVVAAEAAVALTEAGAEAGAIRVGEALLVAALPRSSYLLASRHCCGSCCGRSSGGNAR